MLRECHGVLVPFTQRRQLERKYREPVVEVLAQLAVADRIVRDAVGRRDDAHVGGNFLATTDLEIAPTLEEAEQRHLHLDRHLRDLVQEQRAAVCAFEKAGLRADRAGEAALLVTEELRFDEQFRDCAAIDRNERPRGAAAALVHRFGNELFARAALSDQEDGRVRGSDALDQFANATHCGGAADQTVMLHHCWRQAAFIHQLGSPKCWRVENVTWLFCNSWGGSL